MKRVSLSLIAAALLGAAQTGGAQTDTGRVQPPPAGGRGRAGRAAIPAVRPGLGPRQGAGAGNGRQGQPPVDAAERQAAIRLVRQATARAVRKQLNLNDDQMRTLTRTDTKYERQRQDLQRSEVQTRRDLRAAMLDTAGARDQNKIAGYIDQLAQYKRKGVELAEGEQKELSTFLTPFQRAQYLGLKERIDRRLAELRQGKVVPAGKPDSIPPER